MNETNDLVISTSKLTKSYNGKPVLKALDLKVPGHSIFGFLGPNGAGKTTIKLIPGLSIVRIAAFTGMAIRRFEQTGL